MHDPEYVFRVFDGFLWKRTKCADISSHSSFSNFFHRLTRRCHTFIYTFLTATWTRLTWIKLINGFIIHHPPPQKNLPLTLCSPSSSDPLLEDWEGHWWYFSCTLQDRDLWCCSWDQLEPLLQQIPGAPMTTGTPVVFTPHILSSCSFRPWYFPGSCVSFYWCCCRWALPHWLLQPSCPHCLPSQCPVGAPSPACQSGF